jgi:hypothetical protein
MELPMTLTWRDQVRLTIGDTDESDPQIADSEIDNYLQARSLRTVAGTVVNIPAAAADCAGAIAAKYAREFNFDTDDQRFDRAQRVSHYQALERTLRARAGGQSVPTTLGGTVLPT